MLRNIWEKVKKRRVDRRAEDAFVNLIQVARETPEIRNTLIAILSKDDFNRESILNTYIEEMRYNGAPPFFISSLARLLDKDVAQKAYDLLRRDDDPGESMQ